MKSKKMRGLRAIKAFMTLALLIVAVLTLQVAGAQAPARFVGTVSAINGTTLTVKTDVGQTFDVVVPSEASIKRIAPGQKDLSTAETIQFSDLAVGDRTLVRLDPDAPAGTSQASQIVAIKQTDVAAKQQKDRDDWQRNGVGGLVKSVDAASGVIEVTTGAGATLKTVKVQTGKATVLKRYAPASVNYDAAQPATIDAIHAGDQLRARGKKNADGTEIEAAEVVSGTFRNISGVISAVDVANSTVSLKDLATKKPITIHITATAQMRRIPDRMATMLAARLKGTSGGGGDRGGFAGSNAQAINGGAGQRSGGGQGGPPAGGPPAGGMAAGGPPPGGGPGGSGGGQWSGQGPGGGDPQQMLSRAPAIQIADLKKGDAVMLVSTDGTTDVTVITLLAGVEPLLEAPAASNMLSNWSMGGGADAAAAQ
jgi:hypothetical protein